MQINTQESLEKHEYRLKKLLKQRQDVLQELKSIRKRKKFYQYSSDQVRKVVKKDEEISKDNQKRIEMPPQTIKEQFIKANQIQASLKERNKRIFGGVSNYLMKAKNTLLSQQSKIKQKIQIQQKTMEKERKQAEKLREERKKRLDEESQVANKTKDQNAKQILKYQNLILHHKYNNYVNQLSSLIFTSTQPPIPWKPARQSNLIKKLFDQSKGQQEVLHDKIFDAIDSYNQVFDWCKFHAENEEEYNRNKMNSYYGHKSYNIITKTQPYIFWRPISLMNQALKQSHQYSNSFLAEVEQQFMQEKKSIQERKNIPIQKGENQQSDDSMRQEDSK